MEIRRVDGVEAPDAGVTDLVNARRDGADREQFLEVMYPVVRDADRAAQPLRPQRFQSVVLLQAFARVRRGGKVAGGRMRGTALSQDSKSRVGT